jgi:hypothetical protein
VLARLATPADAAAIARIYNEGIAERIATFETRPRTYIRHAKLDGEWRDVVVIEKFLAPVSPRHVEPGAGAHAPRAGRDAILQDLRAGSHEGIGAAIVALRAFLERGAFADQELVDAAIVAFASTSAHAPERHAVTNAEPREMIERVISVDGSQGAVAARR